MRTQVLLAVATASLAACQPGAETPAAAAAEDAAAPAAATQAESRLREGLWQTTMTAGDTPPVVSRMCVDADMNAFSASMSQPADNDCSQEITPVADGMRFSMRCAMGASGEMSSEGSLTGDFQTGYRMESTTTTEGAAMAIMNGTVTTVSEAVYQGACPAGWRGGDMEITGLPQRINIHDMQAQAEAAAAASG